MMLGKVDAHTLIVMDAFALPVEGTETRVNAHEEAYSYMCEFSELNEQTSRKEKVRALLAPFYRILFYPIQVIGWYHSHPGYGCWLSGIDVATQAANQNHLDPFVAVVVR